VSAADRYVPPGIWSRSDQPDAYEKWFGDQLRAMREPVLWRAGDCGGYARRFRLLVLPSFHPAYAVRVDQPHGGDGLVRVARLSGRGGYAPGSLAEEESYVLPRAEMARLAAAIDQSGLAALPPEPPGDEQSGLFLDGVQFVFELVDDEASRFVTRHLCELSPALARLVEEADCLRRTVGSDLREYR
jgi:hypothetical protein